MRRRLRSGRRGAGRAATRTAASRVRTSDPPAPNVTTTSGTPSSRSSSSSPSPTIVRASSSESLRIETWRRSVAVEVAVERERADLARPDEPVAVEQHASPARDPLERLGREVVAQQRRDVHPLDPPQRALRLVAFAPRLPDRLDAHLPVAVGVVTEGEGASSRRPSASDTGRPSAARRRRYERRSGSPHFATTIASCCIARSARAAYHGPPPMRSARPSTTSRDRGPITASGRTTRKRKAERQDEGESEARQRAADRSLAGMRVVDEVDPRARPDRREPLVEAEAGEPRDDLPRAEPPERRRGRARPRATARAARRRAARRTSRAGRGSSGS